MSDLSFAVRRKVGRRVVNNSFVALNAGALRVLEAAMCSVVKGFRVLSFFR